MPRTQLQLVTGDAIAVAGALEDVAKVVADASRSSAGALAWFEDAGGARLAINPAHVVAIRPEED